MVREHDRHTRLADTAAKRLCETDVSFEAGRASPVSYMSSSNPASKVCKFITHRSLLIVSVSLLPRPPSYSVSYPPSCPESNSRGCSARYPVRNPESYLARYSVSYRANHPEENSASYSESCRESNRQGSSPDCPGNCPASGPESNPPSNGTRNPENYPEGCSADSTPDPLPSNLRNTARRLLGQDNLADGLRRGLAA